MDSLTSENLFLKLNFNFVSFQIIPDPEKKVKYFEKQPDNGKGEL